MHKTLFLAFALIFFGCSKPSTPPTRPTVLATIAPYATFAKQIGGDTFDVQTLIPQGTNLHLYEPTPKALEKSGSAAIWFQIEEPFEKKITQVFREKNPSMRFVNLQKGLPLLSGHAEHTLGGCSHQHGQYDLHTWTSPRLALLQAKKIADELIALFPEHEALYQRNFNHLAKDLQQLNEELTEKLAPFHGNAILLSHSAMAYFCKDYDLIQLAVECEGKEPRPKDLEKILEQAEVYTVQCALLQQGFNNQGALMIAKRLRLPYYRFDPFAPDYIENMRQIGDLIAK